MLQIRIIGAEDKIDLKMEARDSMGNWGEIEEEYVFICGTGLRSLLIPPGQVILTSAPIFKGTFQTDLRVKSGENHSNMFRGNIHYRQFESPFNEYGQYKSAFLKEEKTASSEKVGGLMER